jgi:hypothetical protein
MENTPIKSEKAEETFKIHGNWSDQSKELKSKFPQLTDSDLKFESGKENEMLKRVESRLSKTRSEVIGLIKNAQPKAI